MPTRARVFDDQTRWHPAEQARTLQGQHYARHHDGRCRARARADQNGAG